MKGLEEEKGPRQVSLGRLGIDEAQVHGTLNEIHSLR